MKVFLDITQNTAETAKYLKNAGFKHDGCGVSWSGVIWVDTDAMTEGSCRTRDHILTTLDELKEIMNKTTLEQALEAYKAGKTVNVQLRAYNYTLDDDVRLGHLIDPDARFGIEDRKTFTQILNGMNTLSYALENGHQSTGFRMKEIIDAAIDELIRLNALVENSAP